MRTALIHIEGVLADERSPLLPECQSLREGILLFASLKNNYSIWLYTKHSKEQAQYWLDREGFIDRNGIIPDTADSIETLRRTGNDVQLLVSADPEHIRTGFLNGVNGLLAVHSTYARAEWMPEYDPTPPGWSDLVQTVEAKRLELAADKRLAEHGALTDG